jgi:hypothetical protein
MQPKRTETPPGEPVDLRPSTCATPIASTDPSGRSADEAIGRLDLLDKRQVFKQMVVGSLDSGFLRYSRRKALLHYAAGIGISEFDAMLLIAEAQFYADRIEPAPADGSWLLEDPPHIEVWSAGTRLLLAFGVAAILDAALICWLIV